MLKMFKKAVAVASLSLAPFSAFAAEALQIDVYNPGDKSMFPVTSTLITGESEALLVDAQFQNNDASALVNMIKDSGKKLKAIYITHGDPDFYFGLETIKKSYPEVPVYASPKTLEKIKKSHAGKLAFWGPKLGDNAPSKVIIPQPLANDRFRIDGQDVQIIGLKGHDPKRTFVWVPSIKTVLGSISVFDNQHVWIADTQSQESRDHWMKTLDIMEGMKPDFIIPGHYLGKSTYNLDSVHFTRQYVSAFEKAARTSKTSADLIKQLEAQYPPYANKGTLALSAKVIMGEMKWGS